MKIQAKIDRLVKGGSTKAIASVTLDSWFVVKGLRVVDGKKGLFMKLLICLSYTPEEPVLIDSQQIYGKMT